MRVRVYIGGKTKSKKIPCNNETHAAARIRAEEHANKVLSGEGGIDSEGDIESDAREDA